MSDKAHHSIVVWSPQDMTFLKELVETAPLQLSGKPLKVLLDNPDVTSKLIQREEENSNNSFAYDFCVTARA